MKKESALLDLSPTASFRANYIVQKMFEENFYFWINVQHGLCAPYSKRGDHYVVDPFVRSYVAGRKTENPLCFGGG